MCHWALCSHWHNVNYIETLSILCGRYPLSPPFYQWETTGQRGEIVYPDHTARAGQSWQPPVSESPSGPRASHPALCLAGGLREALWTASKPASTLLIKIRFFKHLDIFIVMSDFLSIWNSLSFFKFHV